MLRFHVISVLLGLLVGTLAVAGFDPISQSIVGGSLVDTDDQIFHSTVMVDAGRDFCSGTMISADLVVTAAHCVTYGDNHLIALPLDALRVYFPGSVGGHGIARFVHVAGFEVSQLWANHVGQEKDQGDVALVRMVGNVPPLYQGATFWPGPVPLSVGTEAVLAGFGVSSLPVNHNGGVLRKASVLVQDPEFSRSEVQLDQSRGAGACYGDSGGPAFIVSDQGAFFWGVASRGDADCAHRMFYTRIDRYREWLQQAAVRLGGAPPSWH